MKNKYLINSKEPIKSQDEANKVFSYMVDTTADRLNISHEQAVERVNALFSSGILDGGSPDNPVTQMRIDQFLQTPIN